MKRERVNWWALLGAVILVWSGVAMYLWFLSACAAVVQHL